jgi:hypothetical protein
MNRSTPTTTDNLVATETPNQKAPKLREMLRSATAEIQAELQQGAQLQKEIDARRAEINEAISQLLKAA